MQYKTFILIVIVLLSSVYELTAQVDTAIRVYVVKMDQLPANLIGQLESKYAKLNDAIEGKSTKLLERLQRQERKLYRKLIKIDSSKAKDLFANTEQYYDGLKTKLSKKTAKLQSLHEYIPNMDSLRTATNFLQNAGANLKNFPALKSDQFKQLNNTLSNVQSTFQSATEIRKLLSERKQQLQQALQQYNFAKQFKNLNKEIFYYQEQLKEYKSLLQNKKKIEQKVMSFVKEMPAFTAFMSKNSELAKLFPMPSNYGTAQALAGLQTRDLVQNALTQRISGGNNLQQYLQQQMQFAQSQLNELKAKANKLGNNNTIGDGGEMPNFKPNGQKTKSFWKRIEYVFNIQSQKTNFLLPTTTDFALTAGYKLNDKSTIGFGASYKLGWGNGLNAIRLSNQGMGLRSFIDIKLKGSIWLSGGYELDYLPDLRTRMDELRISNLANSSWQCAGIIGLSKKYTIGKKTHILQLLWDFLSNRQIPRTEALKFRVGFKF